MASRDANHLIRRWLGTANLLLGAVLLAEEYFLTRRAAA